MSKIIFDRLPETIDELKALTEQPGFSMTDPNVTAALTLASLCAFPKARTQCYLMLQYLMGPQQLSPYRKQFIADRFMDGKDYIPRSYFAGATPENNYTPSEPLTVEITESNIPQAPSEGIYKTLAIASGGADSPRAVTLRQKPSTGIWYLHEQFLLVGIRTPLEQDPWA